MKTLRYVFLAMVLVALTAHEGHARNITSTFSVVHLSSPSNGAIIKAFSVTLVWEKSADAVSQYHVEISKDGSFTSKTINSYIGAALPTQTTISDLENNTTYYWRVTPTVLQIPGEPSSVWHFTCQVPAPEVTLVAPSNGSTLTAGVATLTWKSYPFATQYWVTVSRGAGSGAPFYSRSSGTATQASISGLGNATYSWRVKATVVVVGLTSYVSSPAWSFQVQVAPPQSPTLSSPPNNSTVTTASATLQWLSVQDASKYSVEVSNTDPVSGTTNTYSAVTYGNTQTTVSGLILERWYSWHVQATNNCGLAGGWSPTWKFKRILPPPVLPGGPGTVKP